MRVRIVCYEDVDSWIIGKFALKLAQELEGMSVRADIAKCADPAADINHHIVYVNYDGVRSSTDTLMITHVDAHWKLRNLRRQMKEAALGICMSSHTRNELIGLGLPAQKLCFVNPAHDGDIKPRPLVIGITTRLYADGRKREAMLLQVARTLGPEQFAFAIMGEGWDEIVAQLRGLGFTVEYHPLFDRPQYNAMIPRLDFYLYLGMDEGSMGFVDAVAAGVPTIVTSQGYHLDAPAGLTHPFETEEELAAHFRTIACQRSAVVQAVADWTWRDYAVKHLQIWRYLLEGTRPESLTYADGLASLLAPAPTLAAFRRPGLELALMGGSVRSILSSYAAKRRKGDL